MGRGRALTKELDFKARRDVACKACATSANVNLNVNKQRFEISAMTCGTHALFCKGTELHRASSIRGVVKQTAAYKCFPTEMMQLVCHDRGDSLHHRNMLLTLPEHV